MSFNFRVFLSYFVILGIAIYLLLNAFMSELKPGVRQSTEDALVDMSNVLAELVAEDFNSGRIQDENFANSMGRFLQRAYRAKISFINKKQSHLRVYVTDNKGIVVYDSEKIALGEDYSRWNDVYLTLRGQYGARSTLADPSNDTSSVMHVAAPILLGDDIVGVLTVAKPNLSLQPFIDKAQKQVRVQGMFIIAVSFFVTVAIAYWLTRSIRKLAKYSDQVAQGQRVEVPKVNETELAKLANSIENMRIELDGKDYIEKYVYALTHELKSPVSAIKGAAEIISPDMPVEDQRHFISNIQFEVERIDELISRLLALVTVEKQTSLEKVELVVLSALIERIRQSKETQLMDKKLDISADVSADVSVYGDTFLLTQAVDNLLQNAIDFSPCGGKIHLSASNKNRFVLEVADQ
jgi:two-component system sensor histidine kinase CreC